MLASAATAASVRGRKAPPQRRQEDIRGLKFLSGVADTLIVAQGSRHRTKKWVTSEGGAKVGKVDTHAGSTV